MNKKTLQITETALMIAILVVFQYLTRSLGQFVTGSCVNFILGVSTLVFELPIGICIALISPVFAFLFGIGPASIILVPGVMIGNLVLVITLYYAFKLLKPDSVLKRILTILPSAILKFVSLTLVMTKVLIPFTKLPPEKVKVMTAMFTWPQLITALIGLMLVALIYPVLKSNKEIKKD